MSVRDIILAYLKDHHWAYSFSFKAYGVGLGVLHSDETYARILRTLFQEGKVFKKKDKKFTIYYV